MLVLNTQYLFDT